MNGEDVKLGCQIVVRMVSVAQRFLKDGDDLEL